MSRKTVTLLGVAAMLAVAGPSAASAAKAQKLKVEGLERTVKLKRDKLGIPHVYAKSEHDAYLVMGYLHAEDRFFQMDQNRRQAAGTLAELLGSSALGSDAQLRTVGLLRAAQRSLAAASPKSVALLQAYSDGVNSWLKTNPLPSEYTALELSKTSVKPWVPLNSVAVAKLLAFGLSFDLDDIARTQRLIAYQTAGGALGFDGEALFSQDVMRSEPFAHAPSIMPGETSGALLKQREQEWSSSFLDPEVPDLAEEALQDAKAADLPVESDELGSNIWVVSDDESASGEAMVANDPHLALDSPATFYEAGIDVKPKHGKRGQRKKGKRKALHLYGVTFPGTPAIVHGTNGPVSWGSTVNPTDVTDVYQEQLTIQNGIPVATTYQGNQEPTTLIPATFRANQPGNGTTDDLVVIPPSAGVPPAIVVVPRRNNGPIVSITGNTGLSVQYTGFSPTRELDFFRRLSRADTVEEAIRAQRFFDVGAQNWMYADDKGNIGYKTSAEIPLREDLQAGTVNGLPPFFIRDGTGGNEWIPDSSPASDQALDYQILPFSEMDGLVNPARGWISNANQDPNGQTFDNDPLNELRPGGGIRYITPGHADGNRNTRISARIEQALSGGATFDEMQSIQSDVRLNDAEVLMPFISAAFDASQDPGAPGSLAALGDDPAVQEAVSRLEAWQFSTPTGLPQGYDASDPPGSPSTPTQAEIDASVATTIYSLWRGRAVAGIVDAPLVARGLSSFLPGGDQAMSALRHLLETDGTGASGIAFYADEADRDTKILQALRQALDLAASAEFAPAFGESTNQEDYLWGELHRIVFDHPLGGPFSLPPGAGFDDVGPGLLGVATDGGFGVVDASSHNPRAATLNGFTFGSGPARRFVSEARKKYPRAVQVIPGGESGNPADPWFGNQLGLWLTDDYHRVLIRPKHVKRNTGHRQRLVPAR